MSRLIDIVTGWIEIYQPAINEAKNNPSHRQQVDAIWTIQEKALALLLAISDGEDNLTELNLGIVSRTFINQLQQLDASAYRTAKGATKEKSARGGSLAVTSVGNVKMHFAHKVGAVFKEMTGKHPSRTVKTGVEEGVWMEFLHDMMVIVLKDHRGDEYYARIVASAKELPRIADPFSTPQQTP
ncbi:MAG: hypothetical protein O6944_04150 [Gammaproteobacteria bacterium]|nr:hypothetical protein [Gammaproteobacteria bacterium]